MNDDIRVWIRRRKLKSRCRCRGPCRCRPRYSYDLRWLGSDGRWRSKAAGRDKKIADRAAARLEDELTRGTHCDIQRVSWNEFVLEHVSAIEGDCNRSEAKRTLEEFGTVCNPGQPRLTRFGHIEAFVGHLRSKSNSVATINKKLRYLRAAFNKAVKRDYIARNPMAGWLWTREDVKEPRIATCAEEAAVLQSAERLCGLPVVAFITVALNTGARRGEILGLRWSNIDLESGRIHFTKTKGKRERSVFVHGDVISLLQRLRVKTLREAGPFSALADNLGRTWGRVIRDAKVSGLSIHDLRRTYITRQIRAGTPLPTVQKLAGHADISTTIRFYNLVNDDDLKKAIVQPRKVVAG